MIQMKMLYTGMTRRNAGSLYVEVMGMMIVIKIRKFFKKFSQCPIQPGIYLYLCCPNLYVPESCDVTSAKIILTVAQMKSLYE